MPRLRVPAWTGACEVSFSHDLYIARDSWLHRADPRVKLAFVFLATIALLAHLE